MYTYIVERDVSVTKVITTLGYIFLLRLPMAIAPKAIGMAAEALVSFRRIENFLFHGTCVWSYFLDNCVYLSQNTQPISLMEHRYGDSEL